MDHGFEIFKIHLDVVAIRLKQTNIGQTHKPATVPIFYKNLIFEGELLLVAQAFRFLSFGNTFHSALELEYSFFQTLGLNGLQ